MSTTVPAQRTQIDALEAAAPPVLAAPPLPPTHVVAWPASVGRPWTARRAAALADEVVATVKLVMAVEGGAYLGRTGTCSWVVVAPPQPAAGWEDRVAEAVRLSLLSVLQSSDA